MARPVQAETAQRYEDHKAIIANANQQAQRASDWRSADEARSQPMAVLGVVAKYIFRTRPGTVRLKTVRIPTLTDDYPGGDRERTRRESDFAKRRLKVDGPNPPYNLDTIREKVGSEYIQFKPIPGKAGRQTGSFYPTDHDDVAAFLLKRMKDDPNGFGAEVICEYPTRTVTVNGQQYPATSAGWEAAQAAMLEAPDLSEATGP